MNINDSMRRTPWGFEFTWANSASYSGRVIIVAEGHKTPKLYHKRQDKTIAVLQGVIHLHIEDKVRQLEEGDTYHIRPKMKYSIIAAKGDATILEAGTKLEKDIVFEK